MTRLGPIACVTIASNDIDLSLRLYREHLDYRCVEQGAISLQMAQLWNLPKLVGRRYALTLPEGQGQTYIRFVHSQTDPGYRPFRHMGWNAAELMVQDTDAVAQRLANSPFKIIGPPADLSFSDKIRAMQVLGPSGESLYLTSFKEKLPIFDTPDAHCFIDRTFIVIVGGPSVAAVNQFYTDHFGIGPVPVIPSVITVISQAHGLPPNASHDLVALSLHGQSFIEADTMPAGTLPRLALNGELPPAIAMVSFVVDDLPNTGLRYLAPATKLDAAPYLGRKAALCTGVGGELIELIESVRPS